MAPMNKILYLQRITPFPSSLLLRKSANGKSLQKLGKGNIIIASAGLIPGYWFAIAFIDIIGRKRMQQGGFLALTLIFTILGFGLNKLSSPGLFVLFCLANFFCGFGPNTTAFVFPGEVFPTRYRSTGHGISAASGKIGAILAQALIGPLRNKGGPNAFLNRVMFIFATFMYFPSLNYLNDIGFWDSVLHSSFLKPNAGLLKISQVRLLPKDLII
jgi:MFS family permease